MGSRRVGSQVGVGNPPEEGSLPEEGSPLEEGSPPEEDLFGGSLLVGNRLVDLKHKQYYSGSLTIVAFTLTNSTVIVGAYTRNISKELSFFSFIT